jgi:hypothetical protein
LTFNSDLDLGVATRFLRSAHRLIMVITKLFQKLFSGLKVMERTDSHSYNPLSAKGINKSWKYTLNIYISRCQCLTLSCCYIIDTFHSSDDKKWSGKIMQLTFIQKTLNRTFILQKAFKQVWKWRTVRKRDGNNLTCSKKR